MKIIITMAGLGSRFKKAGYNENKHEILFNGKTLFEWSLNSLINFKEYQFIFVTRPFFNIHQFISDKAKNLGISNYSIKVIDQLTKGQAETVLFAKEYLDSYDSILIYNIDTFVHPSYLKPEDIRGNGWIPVFEKEGTRWSFIQVDENDQVVRTAEKERISNLCSLGLYYFDSYDQYETLVYESINKGDYGKELYVAPLYNKYIALGKRVFIRRIPGKYVLVLGTPEDLKEAHLNHSI